MGEIGLNKIERNQSKIQIIIVWNEEILKIGEEDLRTWRYSWASRGGASSQ